MNPPSRSDGQTPLAVFDLDGTLLRGDSLLPFLLRFGRRRWRWRALASMGLPLVLYQCRLLSARSAKQWLLKSFLRGEDRTTLIEAARSLCHEWIDSHLRPVGMDMLRKHQESGHRVILLTASPDVYVPIVAKHLSIDEVVCTRVVWDGDICTGAIIGDNCKGEAKLAMLRDYLKLEQAPVQSHAYGDSRSDLPVLNWVRHGYMLRDGQFEPCAGHRTS